MLLPIWPGTGRTLVDPLRGAEGPFVAVGAAPVVNKDQALLYFFFFLFALMLYLGAWIKLSLVLGHSAGATPPPHSQKDKRTGRFLLY